MVCIVHMQYKLHICARIIQAIVGSSYTYGLLWVFMEVSELNEIHYLRKQSGHPALAVHRHKHHGYRDNFIRLFLFQAVIVWRLFVL